MHSNPRVLATIDQLNAYWPQLEPLFASSPIAEELTTNEIMQNAVNGSLIIVVFEEKNVTGPEVELALLLAPNASETLPVMNIITVVGRNLRANIKKHWDAFKGWCYINGARAIDAYVPDERLEALVGKELGFKRKSVHVRLGL